MCYPGVVRGNEGQAPYASIQNISGLSQGPAQPSVLADRRSSACLRPKGIDHERASCTGAAGGGALHFGRRALFSPGPHNPTSVGLRSSLKGSAGTRPATKAPQKETKRRAQHEAPRVHGAAWRRGGCVAARGKCAGGGPHLSTRFRASDWAADAAGGRV